MERFRRLSRIRLKYALDLLSNNPIGWLQWLFTIASQTAVTAIVVYQILPSISGFEFLGTIYDALRLGLIFCIVNLFISMSAIIAIPLYILCILLLVYFGCDLPIIGLILAPFMAALYKLISRFNSITRTHRQNTANNPKDFKPLSSKGRKVIQQRMYWLVGLPLAVIFTTISVRIVADFFPNIFVVRNWTVTLLVALILTLSNQILLRLISIIRKKSTTEFSLTLCNGYSNVESFLLQEN